MTAPPGSTATLRAVQIPHHGDVEVLKWVDLPRPVCGAGEVRVDIATVGLNHLDLWVRKGVPGHRFPLPLTPGCDGAGTVSECGSEVTGVAVGQRVVLSPGTSCGNCPACLSGQDPLCRHYGILGETRAGTCAESIVVPAANVVALPDSIDFVQAGCFVLVALTSWTMLVERARIRPGEEVLILAGGSGVGSLAIQIAKLFGCRVLATAGGDDKCRQVLGLGADEVIDHNSEDIAARVKQLTGGRGVDVVFEHVGEATWQSSLRSLAWGGRLVTCGATTGAHAECDLRMVFFKNLSILGSTMGSKGVVHRLVKLLAEGRLRAIVGATLPFDEIVEAHRVLEQRRVFGKVVLTR